MCIRDSASNNRVGELFICKEEKEETIFQIPIVVEYEVQAVLEFFHPRCLVPRLLLNPVIRISDEYVDLGLEGLSSTPDCS